MPPSSAERDDFATTLWSVVLQAKGDDTSARVALAELCRQYWFPIYAYLRRKTGSPENAEDLTQGFFAHLLSGNGLAVVNPDRGRFRAASAVRGNADAGREPGDRAAQVGRHGIPEFQPAALAQCR